MGLVPYFDDASGFVHLDSPAHHKFTQHSNDTFFMMIDNLETLAGPAREERERCLA